MTLKTGFLATLTCLGLPLLGAMEDNDFSGHLYGTVRVKGGKFYEGFMRWGSEETFWGDYFNSSKGKTEFSDYQSKTGSKERNFNVFNHPFRVAFGVQRVFTARFGDIQEIEADGGNGAIVTMKSGKVYRVEGASNDVGAQITILDKDFGEIQIHWRRIEKISFQEVPAAAGHDRGQRLYGTVLATNTSFKGFIQWDKQECLTIDKLDGHTDDGRIGLVMGVIKNITKIDGDSCRVLLKDGRELILSDSNDVDSGNRGIYVEDQRYGRVRVPWSEFVSLSLERAPNSGPGYGEFAVNGPLQGTVTTKGGETRKGRLVFDLDEQELWELLNGKIDRVDYDIPFAMIDSIQPKGSNSLVLLKNGQQLMLGGKTDVDDSNTGLLVFVGDGSEPNYIAWKEVREIDLE